MTDHSIILKKAAEASVELDQKTINSNDTIDIKISFVEGGQIISYAVRFYKEVFHEKVIWSYPKIIERS